jgi:hypothetical protein
MGCWYHFLKQKLFNNISIFPFGLGINVDSDGYMVISCFGDGNYLYTPSGTYTNKYIKPTGNTNYFDFRLDTNDRLGLLF